MFPASRVRSPAAPMATGPRASARLRRVSAHLCASVPPCERASLHERASAHARTSARACLHANVRPCASVRPCACVPPCERAPLHERAPPRMRAPLRERASVRACTPARPQRRCTHYAKRPNQAPAMPGPSLPRPATGPAAPQGAANWPNPSRLATTKRLKAPLGPVLSRA